MDFISIFILFSELSYLESILNAYPDDYDPYSVQDTFFGIKCIS
ncbi:hypothetical protein SC09_contig8orf00195 [Bacillus subtilis]|uniref:Uncharacterized protein n=1 Tax=Bacillus subtilis TaxID=1423 RepID=A0A0D1K8S1_BACIU|nr:hypothetical protein SC09_contig8orf00195 [Bacillus subtilis]